jgi:hypothetical protein
MATQEKKQKNLRRRKKIHKNTPFRPATPVFQPICLRRQTIAE